MMAVASGLGVGLEHRIAPALFASRHVLADSLRSLGLALTIVLSSVTRLS